MTRPCPVCHGCGLAWDERVGAYGPGPCLPCDGSGVYLRRPPRRFDARVAPKPPTFAPRAQKSDRTVWKPVEIAVAVDSATYAEYVQRARTKGHKVRTVNGWQRIRGIEEHAGRYVRPALRGHAAIQATRRLTGRA